jgi:hypothetical protein
MKRASERVEVCVVPERADIEVARFPFKVNTLPSDAVIVQKIRMYHGMVDVVASKLGVSCEALTERIGGREDFDLEIRLAREKLNASKKLALADALYRGDLSAMSLELARQKVEQDRGAGASGSGGGNEPIDFTREVESVRDLSYAEIVASFKRHVMTWTPESGEPCPTCGVAHVSVADETKTKGKE